MEPELCNGCENLVPRCGGICEWLCKKAEARIAELVAQVEAEKEAHSRTLRDKQTWLDKTTELDEERAVGVQVLEERDDGRIAVRELETKLEEERGIIKKACELLNLDDALSTEPKRIPKFIKDLQQQSKQWYQKWQVAEAELSQVKEEKEKVHIALCLSCKRDHDHDGDCGPHRCYGTRYIPRVSEQEKKALEEKLRLVIEEDCLVHEGKRCPYVVELITLLKTSNVPFSKYKDYIIPKESVEGDITEADLEKVLVDTDGNYVDYDPYADEPEPKKGEEKVHRLEFIVKPVEEMINDLVRKLQEQNLLPEGNWEIIWTPISLEPDPPKEPSEDGEDDV